MILFMVMLLVFFGISRAATEDGGESQFRRAAAARFAATHSKLNPQAASARRPMPPDAATYSDTRPLTRDERADLDLLDSVRDGEIPKAPAGRARFANVSGESGGAQNADKATGSAPGTTPGGAAAPAVRPKTRTFELDGGHIPKELSFPGKKQ